MIEISSEVLRKHFNLARRNVENVRKRKQEIQDVFDSIARFNHGNSIHFNVGFDLKTFFYSIVIIQKLVM